MANELHSVWPWPAIWTKNLHDLFIPTCYYEQYIQLGAHRFLDAGCDLNSPLFSFSFMLCLFIYAFCSYLLQAFAIHCGYLSHYLFVSSDVFCLEHVFSHVSIGRVIPYLNRGRHFNFTQFFFGDFFTNKM